MFENFNLPGMDDETLDFTEQFVKDIKEWTQRADTKTPGGEDAATVKDMGLACDQMLLRIAQEKLSRRQNEAATKIQAVARGFLARQEVQKQNEAATKIQSVARGFLARQELQRQNEAATKIQALTRGFLTRRRFTMLKQQANNYQALEGGVGGVEMLIPRAKMLASLRGKLTRHLGTNAPLAFQLHDGSRKVQDLLNYLDGWENAMPEEIGFKALLRSMQKGICHRLALNQALATPTKIDVTNADLSLAGVCTSAIGKKDTYGAFYIPNTMCCTFQQGKRNIVIDIQGFGATKPPMTKHLKEFLDSFGAQANVFDAIAYCRSWIKDLASIPYDSMKACASLPPKGKSRGREATRLYGRSLLRWEFLLKVPGDRDGTNADFVCYHIVPKGLATGINPFAT